MKFLDWSPKTVATSSRDIYSDAVPLGARCRGSWIGGSAWSPVELALFGVISVVCTSSATSDSPSLQPQAWLKSPNRQAVIRNDPIQAGLRTYELQSRQEEYNLPQIQESRLTCLKMMENHGRRYKASEIKSQSCMKVWFGEI
jgi:hypothetical protein